MECIIGTVVAWLSANFSGCAQCPSENSFCHTNYPAQFRRFHSLAEHGHEVVFLHKNIEWHAEEHVNVVRHTYSPS